MLLFKHKNIKGLKFMSEYIKKQGISKFASFTKTKGKIDVFNEKQFHDYYEFYLLLNGKVDFLNEHLRTQISPYTLVIIPPNEYHQFIVLDDVANYERFVLTVDSNLLEKGTIGSAVCGKEILLLDKENRIVKNFFHLNSLLDNISDKDFATVLQSIATDVIFLVKYLPKSEQVKKKSLSPLALKLMEYISKHYAEDCSLKTLSKEFNFSVSLISHTFKKNFGISIKQFIQQKLTAQINSDLKNGEKPEQLAYKYNFANYSTFYRAYKKRFGASPSTTKKSTLNK